MATVEQVIQRLCAANWTVSIHTDGWDGSGEYVVTGHAVGHADDLWEFASGDTLAGALATFAAAVLGDTDAARQEAGR